MEKTIKAPGANVVALDIGGTLAKVAFTLPHMPFEGLVGEGHESQPESYMKSTFNS